MPVAEITRAETGVRTRLLRVDSARDIVARALRSRALPGTL